jgi:cobyrinic acid a,c-diamide synthase
LALPVVPRVSGPRRCRLALARDAAFHFYYEDNLRRLEALGAELLPFSPLADAVLPACDGLLLGGGYPEVHAGRLAANTSMLESIRAFAAAGRPIYAECGGLMYLARTIVDAGGAAHSMVGLVPGAAVVHERLQALGYVEVETQVATPLGAAGVRFRGHQFRYSELRLDGMVPCAYRVRKRRGREEPTPEGYAPRANVLASWVHVHFASNPAVAAALVASAS